MTHVDALKTLAPERYLLGEMSEVERDAFEDHFFSCSECAEDVRTGSLLRDGTKAGLLSDGRARAAGGATVAQFPVRSPRRIFTVAPWALAATLAGVVAYQSMWLLPDLRRQAGPQTLAPIVLRPATRGADPIVTLQQGHAVTLAVDVNAAETPRELSYALINGDGAVVFAGRAPMPPAGAPLLLLFPNTAFASPGGYVLRLGDSSGSADSIGEYRFVVQMP